MHRKSYGSLAAALRKSVIPVLVAVIICLGGSRVVVAQQNVGYILGTVTDGTGAVVAGAAVSIVQRGTGFTQTVTTNNLGYYTSQPLQVGQYTVSATSSGFAPTSIRAIAVDAAAHVQINLTLHLGAISERVTVEGTPPVIDTTDAQLSNTIDSRAAQQLPVNGRSVLALAAFTPGVVSSAGPVSEGFQNRGTAVSAIRIVGGAPGYNDNILDGVSNQQDFLGEVAINLKSDAVQEFNIMSGVIPAQFGYTSGGVINVVTRAGTNNLHGSIYEFLRNDALDATQAWPRSTKQELRFNNYGGTLGGPLLRNKAFLFGNYEQYNYASKTAAYYTVPTAQERAGNFSDLGHIVNGTCQPLNIYDESNVVNGERQQFNYGGIPNNIDPSRLDPVAVAYQKMFYPLPNNTTGSYDSCTHTDNFLYAFPISATERQGVVRFDEKLSPSDSIVARYAYYRNANNDASGSGGGLPGGVFNNRYDTLQTQDAVLSETHVFRPNLLNDARVGMVRSDFPFEAGSANKNIAGQIGLPNSTPLAIPTMSNGLIKPNITVGFRSATTMEADDDLMWVFQKQTLHLGASASFTEGFNNQTSTSPSGTFNFSAGTTAEGNDAKVTSGTGDIYASYLLGQVKTASQGVYKDRAYRRMLYAVYAQDDWRVTPRLTINAGLRWDFMSQAVEKDNGYENFDITKTNPVNGYAGAIEYAGVDGVGRNFVSENYGDYGPRLGFAYALTPDNTMILRGGVAIYYPGVDQELYDSSSGSVIGYNSFTTSWTAPTAQGAAFQLGDGFPSAWGTPLGSAGGQNAFLGQSAAYVLPVAKDPSAQVFTLTLSRQLPWNWVVDASYLGNHGNHFLSASPNINTLSPQYYSMGTDALSASVKNPYAGIVPGSLGAPTITMANLLKPYPYMSTVTLQAPRNGSYWANLAMLSVQRRMSHGLQVIGGYTFGKITDEGIVGLSDASFVGTKTGDTPQNWRNMQGEHSVDAIDVTHRLTVSALYDLPFGRGRRFLSNSYLNRLLGGWQYNVIMVMESGRPVSINGANNHLATRPNWDPNVSVHVQHPSRSVLYKTGRLEWFNPDAFVNPPDYTFGNVSRYLSNLRGPGTVNFDMSLFKTTQISERVALELRVEAYNALNHANLDMPGTGFSPGASPYNDPTLEGGHNDNTSLGMITSTGGPRNVQLGAKVIF